MAPCAPEMFKSELANNIIYGGDEDVLQAQGTVGEAQVLPIDDSLQHDV